jgi:hypothetical protein
MEGFSMSKDKHPKITFSDYAPSDGVQRRVAELLAALGQNVARSEEIFDAECRWPSNPACI